MLADQVGIETKVGGTSGHQPVLHRLVHESHVQCLDHGDFVVAGFDQIGQEGGIGKFLRRSESSFDHFGAGHAGTSISAALGMARAKLHKGDPGYTIALIGDGSMTAGMAFEAMNHAGHLGQKNLVVVLNDNEWSISKSVGAMARYFSRIRSARLVQRAQQEIQSLINAIPVIGPRVDRTLDQIGEVVRHNLVPGHVFEELGVAYELQRCDHIETNPWDVPLDGVATEAGLYLRPGQTRIT